MGQVPANDFAYPYLLIGNGRLAQHFSHYFQLLSVPHLRWWRRSDTALSECLLQCHKVLLLINDDEIEGFLKQHQKKQSDQLWIHCSGSLETVLAEGAHPLMSFSHELYMLETYTHILFVTAENRRPFSELFPELPNPNAAIPADKKNYYHAWASMAGNFTVLLWTTYFKRLTEELELPLDGGMRYLEQISKNLMTNKPVLTGPLSRGDQGTLQTHLKALGNDPFQAVYTGFIKAFENQILLKGSR